LVERMAAYSPGEVVFATAVTVVIVVAARFIWTYPATYVPRWVVPGLAKRDPSPPWQWTFAIAFTGVRGVVSLAAALAIPFTLANGQPFPERDLILFITFGVILVTVVGLGLVLPAVMRWLGLAGHGAEEQRQEAEAEHGARRDVLNHARGRLA